MDANRLVQPDPGPSQQIIRRFSDDMEERGHGGTLSEGLAVKVSQDRRDEKRVEVLQREWTLLLADADHLAQIAVPDEEKHMLKTSRALATAWKKFQKSLPTAQQGSLTDSPPSLSLLFHSVQNAENTWRQKRSQQTFGKIKNAFARMSQFGDDHSQLLRIIPSNDKYISLLTGSLTAIVQASINHEKLAEALSDTLDKLCTDVAHWKKQVLAHPGVPEMHRLIRDLYVVIFEFFTDIFETWSSSSWKRLALSFDKNAVEKLFQSKRLKIERLTTELDRAARLDTEQKINRLSDSIDQIVTKADLEGIFLRLGSDVQRFLQDKLPLTSTALARDTPKLLPSASSTETTATEADAAQVLEEEITTTLRTDYLQVVPDSLLQGQSEEIQRMLEFVSHLQVDRLVVSKLREWIKGTTGAQLWIQGPPHVPKPSQNTLTAVSLVGKATEATMTTLWYFVSLGKSPASSHPSGMLRRMLQSLLAQVVMALPERISARTGVSPAVLGLCFENDASISNILDAYQELLELIPKPVLCILDGLQILEDRSDRNHTKELTKALEVLCGEVSSDISDFKLCVTTDGHVDLIAALVQKDIFNSVAYELESGDRQANDTVDMRYADVLDD